MGNITLEEFVRLLKQADRAIEKNDLEQLESINVVLEKIGYRVIIRDGKGYLSNAYYGPG